MITSFFSRLTFDDQKMVRAVIENVYSDKVADFLIDKMCFEDYKDFGELIGMYSEEFDDTMRDKLFYEHVFYPEQRIAFRDAAIEALKANYKKIEMFYEYAHL